jgi:hypothetical protein
VAAGWTSDLSVGQCLTDERQPSPPPPVGRARRCELRLGDQRLRLSGSPSSAAGTGSGDALALKFADCMRSHGVPNFPDPGTPVGGRGFGINTQAPEFRSAEQKCDS